MLCDTHVHLDDPQLSSQIEAVIQRAADAGVTHLLSVATTRASSQACLSHASQFPGVRASVGVHPNYAHLATEEDWAEIERLAEHELVVAIGETGLDRYWDDCPFERQLDFFRRHMALARRVQKPFIVHMRDCESEMLEELEREAQNGKLHGVMHSFSGSAAAARVVLDLGMHVSFSGMLTYPKNQELRDIASTIPAHRLLLETDAPYLSPHPHRSRRPNEPELMVHTARCLADSRGTTMREIAAQTTAAAAALFAWPMPDVA